MGFLEMFKKSQNYAISKEERGTLSQYKKQLSEKQKREAYETEKSRVVKELRGPSFLERLGSGISRGQKLYSEYNKNKMARAKLASIGRGAEIKARKAELNLAMKEAKLAAFKQKHKISEVGESFDNPFSDENLLRGMREVNPYQKYYK